MNEENWIEDITDVSGRIQKAEIPSDLLHKLKAIPFTIQSKIDVIPMRTVLLAAASVAVLIAINVLLFAGDQSGSSNDEFINTYFTYTKHI
ncbi:MAG: hypothetical protein ACI865_000403 [Flavobacteriaceae bacterium]|jgi:hypothetical protein